MSGRISRWWLNRRNLILLYRGQDKFTSRIISPLMRAEGGAASEQLVAYLRREGISDPEIASYTARYHHRPVVGFTPPGTIPPEFGPGAAGIPATTIQAIAAGFGRNGVVYVIRVPKTLPIRPERVFAPIYAAEDEYIFLNEVPPGSIIRAIPADRIPPLKVDDAAGLLVPGYQ
jgi:hypothetical protein